jgi:hypothetical protein
VRGWNLTTMLVGQIAMDPYSHLVASFAGWAYVPSPVDVFFLNWVDAQAQMHHRSGKVPPKPVPRPWERGRAMKSPIPDPGRVKNREALMERLGLRGVVDADDEPDGEPEAESDD